MKSMYEMTEIKKQKSPTKLEELDEETREDVLRLINRESYEMRRWVKSDEEISCLYIDPQSTLGIVWALLFMVVFYLTEVQISLELAFGPTFFRDQLKWPKFDFPFYISVLCFLFLDILVSFVKGYHQIGKGRTIDNLKKIVLNYLKTQFYFDILVLGTYIVPLFVQSFGLNFLQLLPALLLWIKKFKYQREVEQYLQYQAGLRAGFMLFILFLDALLFGNYGACIFVGMDILLYREQYYGTGLGSPFYWLTNNQNYPQQLMTGPWYYEYIYGQEFSTGTLSTLAPGPFAKNPWQAFYACLLMVVFMIYASYLADVLIMIVYTYTERRLMHEENIRSFDHFMRLKEVEQSIRLRIYNYFELKWELEFKTQSTQQQEMISKLPSYLKEQLLLQIGFSKHLYFLYALPKQDVLKKLVSLKIQRTTVDADTCIFQDHLHRPGKQSPSIFFIKEGMAKFYIDSCSSMSGKESTLSQRVLSLSNVERVLGVYQFVTGQDYTLCCRSIDLCLIQTLSWNNFLEVITQLRIQEQFFELKHRVLIERELDLIHKVCVVCLESHVETDCPKLYYSKTLQNKRLAQKLKHCENKRVARKRKEVKSTKFLSWSEKEKDVFDMFSSIQLGALLVDILKLQRPEGGDIQSVHSFRHFFPVYNIESQWK